MSGNRETRNDSGGSEKKQDGGPREESDNDKISEEIGKKNKA